MPTHTAEDYKDKRELAKVLLERIDDAMGALEGFTTGPLLYAIAGVHLNEARAHLQAAEREIRGCMTDWVLRGEGK
jgi:hypothetical protein